jgi:hypothetical protein
MDNEQSKVNISKSNLKNSPIIVDSFKKNNDKKQKKNFFSKPYVKGLIVTVVGTILAFLIITIVITPLLNNENMQKEDNQIPKVQIEDSNLDKSPVIVDSPGAQVDNSENVYVDTSVPEITINYGTIEYEKFENGRHYYFLRYGYMFNSDKFGNKDIQSAKVLIYANEQLIIESTLEDRIGNWRGMSIIVPDATGNLNVFPEIVKSSIQIIARIDNMEIKSEKFNLENK